MLPTILLSFTIYLDISMHNFKIWSFLSTLNNNIIVLWNLFRKDALGSLEEAFRAGHSAGDATCLHYCHNLWSNFHNKPYMDAIVTVTKEVDNNMAYLHSINVIANAFDYHYQRMPTEEVLYVSWLFTVFSKWKFWVLNVFYLYRHSGTITLNVIWKKWKHCC